MLFTLPGCTSMYYGDEAGIDGTVDTIEGCRYPMPWNKQIEETDSFKLYSTLCKLKTEKEVFSDGGFKFVYANDGVIAFARFNNKDLYLTVCSNSEKNQKISINLAQFGNSFAIKNAPRVDVLGQKLKAQNKNANLKLVVPAGVSYLIEV